MESDNEEVVVELNEKEAPFLADQTTKSNIHLSPIKVVKVPDGSMQREAMNAVQFSKDRREMRE